MNVSSESKRDEGFHESYIFAGAREGKLHGVQCWRVRVLDLVFSKPSALCEGGAEKRPERSDFQAVTRSRWFRSCQGPPARSNWRSHRVGRLRCSVVCCATRRRQFRVGLLRLRSLRSYGPLPRRAVLWCECRAEERASAGQTLNIASTFLKLSSLNCFIGFRKAARLPVLRQLYYSCCYQLGLSKLASSCVAINGESLDRGNKTGNWNLSDHSK